MKKLWLTVTLAFFSHFSFAAVDVAFVEMRTQGGQLMQLEPGGQFAHIAISYQGKWLHSHPIFGVSIVSTEELQTLGTQLTVISLPDAPLLEETTVNYFLGRPFDNFYSWSDDAIYSSELVAKILGLDPQPMQFNAPFWPPEFHELNGELGISPDDIYLILKQSGY